MRYREIPPPRDCRVEVAQPSLNIGFGNLARITRVLGKTDFEHRRAAAGNISSGEDLYFEVTQAGFGKQR